MDEEMEREQLRDDPHLDRAWDLLDHWRAPEPPDGLLEAVRARTREGRERPAAVGLRRWRWAAWAAAAAAVVLLVLTSGPGLDGPEKRTAMIPGGDRPVAMQAGGERVVSVPPPALLSEIDILENLDVLEAMRDAEVLEEILPNENGGERNDLGARVSPAVKA